MHYNLIANLDGAIVSEPLSWSHCFVSLVHTIAKSLVYTSDISISNENKTWLLLWDFWKRNNENVSLFRLLFCSWLMLGLWSYAYDDPYVAGLTSFLCFAFCFALMLMLMPSCEPGFIPPIFQTLSRDKISLLQVEVACYSKLNWRLLFSTHFFNLQQQNFVAWQCMFEVSGNTCNNAFQLATY